MPKSSTRASFDTEQEYRAIEATLLETARGRWFLTEHSRRARRLDNAVLEDALTRLQGSLLQPPPLLRKLRQDVEDLAEALTEARATLTQPPAARASHGATRPGGSSATATATPVQEILKAAETMHELAWSLQANDTDAKACEGIARQASQIYAMSRRQALESERVVDLSRALEGIGARVTAILDTIAAELAVDAEAKPVHEGIAAELA